MTTHIASSYISDNARTQSEVKTALEAIVSVISEMLGGGSEATATLASDVFTPANNAGPIHMIDTEAAAASDDLRNITATNCRNGHIIGVRCTSSARTITVRNANGGAGQILTQDGANFTLSDPKQFVFLKYKTSSTSWEEIFRTQNIDALPLAGVTANYVQAGPTSGGAAKPTYRALVTADLGSLLNQLAGWLPRTTLAVTSNTLTPTRAVHKVDNSGAAQEVRSIAQTNTPDGTILIINPTNTSATNTVTLKHNYGGATNPLLLTGSADLVMTSSSQYLILLRDSSSWVEIGRLGFSTTGAVQGICQGRLTLTTATPVDITDVTGASTLYFTPFNGNQVATYSGSSWTLNTFTERSLSISALKKYVNYNIFLVDGTLALEALAWKSVTSSSTVTSGSSKTMNVSDTSGVAVGQWITVANSAHTTVEIARVASFVSNTSVTVDSLANGYTNPLLYYNSRATALTTQDGVYVKSGATTRLYLGTIRMTAGDGSSGGTCENSSSMRFVDNHYNKVTRMLFGKIPTTSWSYAVLTVRAANTNTTDGEGRVSFVCGSPEGVAVNAEYNAAVSIGTGIPQIAIGVDSITTSSGYTTQSVNAGIDMCVAQYKGRLDVGFHFVQSLECSTTNGTTFYGTNTYPSNSSPFGMSSGLGVQLSA